MAGEHDFATVTTYTSMFLKRYPLLSYFVLAYALTWAIEVPMLLNVRGVISLHLPAWLEALAAFGPALAAVLVLGFWQGAAGVRELLNSLCRWRVPVIWWLVTLLSPVAIMLGALVITGDLDRLFSGELTGALVKQGRLLEVLLLGGVLRGLGEEPGWRGLALPLLRRRFSPFVATLALWPVWTCWHLPSMLMRPEFALGAWVGFALGMLAAAALLTLLYEHTRSVLLVAIWHALINITRTIAGEASQDAFFMFAQLMMLVGTAIIIYWVFANRNERE